MTTPSQLPSTKAFKYRGEVPSGSTSRLFRPNVDYLAGPACFLRVRRIVDAFPTTGLRNPAL